MDKLTGEGKGVEEVFRPKTTTDPVPGTVGQALYGHTFRTVRIREGDLANHTIEIIVQVVGEPDRVARVRKDANIFEILRRAFFTEDFPPHDQIKLLIKPLKMKEGAIFKFERILTEED
jgi:hypothetical protein